MPSDASQAPNAPSGRPNTPFYNALRAAANGPYRHLMLLSHRRSHSSVLAHALGHSPIIQGRGETQVRFRSLLDPWRMRRPIRESTGEGYGDWLPNIRAGCVLGEEASTTTPADSGLAQLAGRAARRLRALPHRLDAHLRGRPPD